MSHSFPAMPASVETIIRLVCAKHCVSPRDLMGVGRDKPTCDARFEAMYRVRTEIKIAGSEPSLPQIGKWFGRDHTSVLNALRRYGDLAPYVGKSPRAPAPKKLQLVQDMWEAA